MRWTRKRKLPLPRIRMRVATNPQGDSGHEDTSTEKDTSDVKEVPTSSTKTEKTKAVEKTENGAKTESSVDETNDGKPQAE